jgi:phage host-nuclease inhibitor protein Gam
MQTETAPTTELTLTITNDDQLRDVLSDLAVSQLAIKRAANEQAARMEAAKKAFADVTDPIIAEDNVKEQAIEAYCTAHRDRLFTSKKGKAAQTITVLEHKIGWRKSSEIEAPEDIIRRIEQKLDDLAMEARAIDPRGLDLVEHQIDLLNGLLRQPPVELNKDAAKAAAKNEHDAKLLAEVGITETTEETFKISYNLKPEPAPAKPATLAE